jgi:RNA polymerase sigma factor (sigma-70 family)
MEGEPDIASASRFFTTHWSVVLAAGDQDSAEAQPALARLCRSYWFPIYAFIRKRGHSPEEAQDLTQQFFATFLEKNYVARAARERGRFRTFLMSSVQNFLHNERDRAQAQKRGGGKTWLSLDQTGAEDRYQIEPVEESDPAKAFEQRWAATLLENILVRLRSEYVQSDRGELFEALQAHLWGEADSIPYSSLAEQHDLSVSNIKVIAHRLRERYREILREEIAQTVAQPAEVDDEIRYLMRVVSQA